MERKTFVIFVLAILVAIGQVVFYAGPSLAIEFDVLGKPMNFQGFISQGAQYGISRQHWDTQAGFQSFITQALVEFAYRADPNLGFFVSGNFSADWAYPMFRKYGDWKEKQFNRSRGHLFILDDWQDVLKECHVTWTPGKFYIRAGKQIVQWGQTDGFLLTNLINPLDSRRGLGDVKFENTLIPIWLLRTEYNTSINSSWLQELGFQFIFNPNFKFRGNENLEPGNDFGGIWAPNVEIENPFFPFGSAHLGSLIYNIKKIDEFSSKGYDYGFKLTSVIWDSIVTLNYFYGRDRDLVTQNAPYSPFIEVSSWDGKLIIHPFVDGYYPRFHFVGATFTRDFENVRASILGGVAPVLRLETLYAFHSTYGNSNNTFTYTDEFRGSAGIDWKVKIPFLNANNYFMISPQFFYQRLMDYPSGGVTLLQRGSISPGLDKNNYKATLMINTTYFHNKLQPMVFWLHDFTNRADFFKSEVSYEQSSHWRYTVGALLLNGTRSGLGFSPLQHKDMVYASVNYSW